MPGPQATAGTTGVPGTGLERNKKEQEHTRQPWALRPRPKCRQSLGLRRGPPYLPLSGRGFHTYKTGGLTTQKRRKAGGDQDVANLNPSPWSTLRSLPKPVHARRAPHGLSWFPASPPATSMVTHTVETRKLRLHNLPKATPSVRGRQGPFISPSSHMTTYRVETDGAPICQTGKL